MGKIRLSHYLSCNVKAILIYLLFACSLTSCSFYKETTYLVSPNEKEIKDCGYTFTCEYYKNEYASNGEIAVTFSLVDSLTDKQCSQKYKPTNVSVRFSNSANPLKIDTADSKYNYLESRPDFRYAYSFTSPDFMEQFTKNDTLEVTIYYVNAEKPKVFLLTKRTRLVPIYWKFFC